MHINYCLSGGNRMPFEEVFEIPIYRLSPSDWDKELASLYNEHLEIDDYKLFGFDPPNEQIKNVIEYRKDWFTRSELSPANRIWKFNEIIGFIIISVGHNQVRAEYWLIASKRIRRDTVRKKFEYRDKVLELWVRNNEDSNSINHRLMAKLENLRDDSRFKKRYIDMEAFENISPYVDWKSITSVHVFNME